VWSAAGIPIRPRANMGLGGGWAASPRPSPSTMGRRSADRAGQFVSLHASAARSGFTLSYRMASSEGAKLTVRERPGRRPPDVPGRGVAQRRSSSLRQARSRATSMNSPPAPSLRCKAGFAAPRVRSSFLPTSPEGRKAPGGRSRTLVSNRLPPCRRYPPPSHLRKASISHDQGRAGGFDASIAISRATPPLLQRALLPAGTHQHAHETTPHRKLVPFSKGAARPL